MAFSVAAGFDYSVHETKLQDAFKHFNIAAEGKYITLTLKASYVDSMAESVQRLAKKALLDRLESYGLQGAEISTIGQDRLVLDIPGLRHSGKIRKLLQETGQLRIYEVIAYHTDKSITKQRTTSRGLLLPSMETSRNGQPIAIEVQRKPAIVGTQIRTATAKVVDGVPVTELNFNTAAAKTWAEITARNVGRPIAFVLDGVVIRAPTTGHAMLQGSVYINHPHNTLEKAENLAKMIRAGALPVPVVILEERSVGATLGQDSIQSGVIASLVATGLVAGAMMLIFGWVAGGAAVLGLLGSLLLVFTLMGALKAPLTLPGIAGIALMLGMGVDAAILVFERMAEIRTSTPNVSPQRRWSVAFDQTTSGILDSHVTTLLAAILLFLLGSGPVQGFGTTLALGTVCSFIGIRVFMRAVLIQSAR
jgi:preprotein translocase subunit SecD